MDILGFHHLAILVRDLEGMARFYSEVLGLTELTRHHREDGRLRSIWLGLPQGGFFALEAADQEVTSEPFQHGRPGLLLIALRILAADREKVANDLKARRVLLDHQTRWSIYFRDPEGNRIALSHHPEDPPPKP